MLMMLLPSHGEDQQTPRQTISSQTAMMKMTDDYNRNKEQTERYLLQEGLALHSTLTLKSPLNALKKILFSLLPVSIVIIISIIVIIAA